MNTVHRYRLYLAPVCEVRMRIGATILSVQLRQETYSEYLDCWATVDDTVERFETRRFHICGTGEPLPDVRLKHLATVITQDGRLVFHVFEEV